MLKQFLQLGKCRLYPKKVRAKIKFILVNNSLLVHSIGFNQFTLIIKNVIYMS